MIFSKILEILDKKQGRSSLIRETLVKTGLIDLYTWGDKMRNAAITRLQAIIIAVIVIVAAIAGYAILRIY